MIKELLPVEGAAAAPGAAPAAGAAAPAAEAKKEALKKELQADFDAQKTKLEKDIRHAVMKEIKGGGRVIEPVVGLSGVRGATEIETKESGDQAISILREGQVAHDGRVFQDQQFSARHCVPNPCRLVCAASRKKLAVR